MRRATDDGSDPVKQSRGNRHIVLLKHQWALNLAAELRDLAADLPEGHPERPGLICAAEFVRHYGTPSS